jgi:hypothetical protein
MVSMVRMIHQHPFQFVIVLTLYGFSSDCTDALNGLLEDPLTLRTKLLVGIHLFLELFLGIRDHLRRVGTFSTAFHPSSG